jgi:hypothetical protein
MRLISNEELLVVAGGDFGEDVGDDFGDDFDDGFGNGKRAPTPRAPKNPNSGPKRDVIILPTPQQPQPSSGWIEFDIRVSGGLGTNPNTPQKKND